VPGSASPHLGQNTRAPTRVAIGTRGGVAMIGGDAGQMARGAAATGEIANGICRISTMSRKKAVVLRRIATMLHRGAGQTR
jgi:hypothetical protein